MVSDIKDNPFYLNCNIGISKNNNNTDIVLFCQSHDSWRSILPDFQYAKDLLIAVNC